MIYHEAASWLTFGQQSELSLKFNFLVAKLEKHVFEVGITLAMIIDKVVFEVDFFQKRVYTSQSLLEVSPLVLNLEYMTVEP